MCGIYGELSLTSDYRPGVHGEAATDLLRHRGPDERGTWLGDEVFLGMRRLSIIDLDGGSQPIWNEDRTCCVVYNGELYNFLDLRRELEAKGHLFRTATDTEVVVHAYEEWGPGCVRRFNGMFAFALWDGRGRRLLLARDPVGEKPLYYYRDAKRLIFASEIKAILADPNVPRRINFRGLANYLAFGHSVAPETIYEGICKLLPGHYLTEGDGGIGPRRYWDVGAEPVLASQPSISGTREQEYAEQVLDLLDDSVRRRMIADVPVGAFLSGGVDSSAVVALMGRHATGTIKTFSLGFSVGGAYNELSDAASVARFLGTEHHELEVTHSDLVQALHALVFHYDEPFADPAGFPVFLLSRFASEQVKVVLTGDGGDELFGGYRRYVADRAAPLYQRLPSWLTGRCLPAMVDRLPRLRRAKRILHTLPIGDPGRRYAAWLTVFTPEMQAELLEPDVWSAVADHDPSSDYPRHYAGLKGSAASDHLNRLMYIDLKTWLADDYLEKTDKATMACGLEARLPLLDRRLVELAFRLPGSYKIRGLSTKRILKQAVKGLVPPEVLEKPKHGFAVPIDQWLRGDLASFARDVLMDERARRRGYFRAPVLERLWQEHMSGRHVWDSSLWLLLNFELWHRIYLDGEGL